MRVLPDSFAHICVSIRAPAGGAIREKAKVGTKAKVSIRAPAGGAIEGGFVRWHCEGVSIRAPAGGAMPLP